MAIAYNHRIAFGAWINDMRNEPLPLENWPAPQLDDEAVSSAIMAMDVQSEAGFNMLDVFGLFATYGYLQVSKVPKVSDFGRGFRPRPKSKLES